MINKKTFLASLALIISMGFFSSVSADNTVPTISPFVATTSPTSGITQRVFGNVLILSGYAAGCAQFNSSGLLSSTGTLCGSGSGGGFATTSADYWLTTKTTDNLTQGVTNLYYSDAKVGSYITGSTTLPALLNYWTKTGSALTYIAGNVGVGTTSPTSALEVDGRLTIQGTPGVTNADFLLQPGDYSGKWDFVANATAGSLSIYDFLNNKTPISIAKNISTQFNLISGGASIIAANFGVNHTSYSNVLFETGNTLTSGANTAFGYYMDAALTPNTAFGATIQNMIPSIQTGSANTISPVVGININPTKGGTGTITTYTGLSIPASSIGTTNISAFFGNNVGISSTTPGTLLSIGTTNGINLTNVSTSTFTKAIFAPCFSTDNATCLTSGNFITALTGDGTASGPGSSVLTLATVNANVGSFGGASSVPTVTVNAKGLVSAISATAVIAPAGTLSGATLASGVTGSSLTSVGTLSGLTVTAAPTFSAMTLGSVLFAGTAGLLSQDNANFFYNATTHQLGLGSTTPYTTLSVGSGTASSSIVVAEYDYGRGSNVATSTAMTIDARTANTQVVPIGGSAVTLTLCNFTAGQHVVIKIVNPNGTPGALNWASCSGSTIFWPSKTVPTQTVTANAWDIYGFIATNAYSTSTPILTLSGVQNPAFQ